MSVHGQDLERENILARRTGVLHTALLPHLTQRDREQVLLPVGVPAEPRPGIIDVVVGHQHAVMRFVRHPRRGRHVHPVILAREHICFLAQSTEQKRAVARFLLVVRLIPLQLLQKTHCFLSLLKKAVCADHLSVYTHPLSVSRFGARLISRWTMPRTSAPL